MIKQSWTKSANLPTNFLSCQPCSKSAKLATLVSSVKSEDQETLDCKEYANKAYWAVRFNETELHLLVEYRNALIQKILSDHFNVGVLSLEFFYGQKDNFIFVLRKAQVAP